MPSRGLIVTGCEKPTASSRSVPLSWARYPTPTISRRFSKPFVTPSTMFATSVRVSPCSARSSPRSVGRLTTSSPSRCSILMRAGTCCESSPSGPFTWTRPGESATLTLAGSSIGLFPIRLISSLPDETDDFAADSALGRRAARDEAARRRQDRRPHPAEHARQAILARVDPATGLRDPPEPGDHALAIAPELELDDQGIEALALLDAEVPDVALLLEDAGDLLLQARGRHLDVIVHRLVGVADAGEHVGDWIGQHRITSSISSCRGSRPGARAPAGRSGRGRTCGRRRAGARSGCSACSSAP